MVGQETRWLGMQFWLDVLTAKNYFNHIFIMTDRFANLFNEIIENHENKL